MFDFLNPVSVRNNNPKFKMFLNNGKQHPHNLLMGFENEIICKYVYYDADSKFIKNPYLSCLFNINKCLYVKEEASNSSVEINSHPFNWNWYLKNLYGENNFLKYCKTKLCPSKFYVNNKCGFHVHLSRKFFSKKHLLNMCNFFYNTNNHYFFLKISRRKRSNFEAILQ